MLSTAPSGLISSLDATLLCSPKDEVCIECFPSAGLVTTMGWGMALFVFSDVTGWAGVINTVLLDGGVVTTGEVSNTLIVLPIGGTVAMGSVCILETVLTIGGKETVGTICGRVPASTGWMTPGTCFLINVLLRIAGDCVVVVEAAAILPAASTGVSETSCCSGVECGALGITVMGRVIADGLDSTGDGVKDADNLDKAGANVGDMLGKHSAREVTPVANLKVARVEPRPGALGTSVEIWPPN